MNTSNPLQDQLAAAAATAQATQHTEPQVVQAATPMPTQNAPAVAMAVAPAQYAPAAPLTMDSNEVILAGSISDFIKLTDGGLSLQEGKFDPVIFELILNGAESGGSFRPCRMMNYQNPNGYVYTKTYDGVITSSSDASHNGLPWGENVQRIKTASPKAYEFIGYELTLTTHQDIASKDGKTEIPAGTIFGYSTPFTASKQIKAIWDKWSPTHRGQTLLIKLSGEEVSKDGNVYKKLVIETIGIKEEA